MPAVALEVAGEAPSQGEVRVELDVVGQHLGEVAIGRGSVARRTFGLGGRGVGANAGRANAGVGVDRALTQSAVRPAVAAGPRGRSVGAFVQAIGVARIVAGFIMTSRARERRKQEGESKTKRHGHGLLG
ncbi:MAG: hypothetical protein MUF34_20190 [Polyangiaceae bacterium]|nr:hypothetical protein [Polyangiaceae bacterium]